MAKRPVVSGSDFLRRWIVVTLALSACSNTPASDPFERNFFPIETPNASACLAAQPSRWLPTTGYQVQAEFGRGEPWLGHVQSLAFVESGQRLLAYDTYEAAVLVLDPELRLLDQFGRRGLGPGELALQGSYGPSGALHVSGSSVYVVDLRSVNHFSVDGEFQGYVAGPGPATYGPSGTVATGSLAGSFMYAVDQRSGARRTLELRVAGDTSPLTALELPPTPTVFGQYTNGTLINQAQPLASIHGDCAIMSDGSSNHIVSHNLVTAVRDTVQLPEYEIPREAPEDRARRDRNLQLVSSLLPRQNRNVGEPTAHVRWLRLVTDPDGTVWIEPWRPRSMRVAPVPVYLVNGGGVRKELVPAFPDAFGPPGVYYAVVQDSATDVFLIQRYGQ